MAKKPNIPRERSETTRRELLSLLDGHTSPIGELSRELGVSERELYGHLAKLHEVNRIAIIPAKCMKCGYRYEHRTKIRKPSKCPNCKSTYIKQPEFTSRT